MPVINIKRIYEDAEPSDGFRILVDKLWPRGISKDRAKLDYWAKQLAPSDGLRKWYQHDEDKWEVFQKKYNSELDDQPEALLELMTYLERGDVTFLFSSKELHLNNAVALKAYIISRSK
jgi:uncharacterized protein YeaO (DUF488 family)